MKNYRYLTDGVFYGLLLIVLFAFYSMAHPIIPFDADDWENLTFFRGAYPSLHEWNPTKIFPECFEPLVGLLAAYVVTPLVGDYLDALVYANALTVTLFILLYLFSMQRLLEHRFQLSRCCLYLVVGLYALFHFWILRTGASSNEHLWFSHDANCYYHYTIPNLLCASLVLWLMRHGMHEHMDNSKKAALILILYLALCSNLYSTVILIAYLGASLLVDLIQFKKEGAWLKMYCTEHVHYLAIVALWLCVQIEEMRGGRAHFSHMQDSLSDYLQWSATNFVSVHYNVRFVVLALVISVGSLIIRWWRGNRRLWIIGRNQVVILLALVLSALYLILLSSRVDPLYMLLGQVIFSYAFFALLLVVMCVAYLTKHVRIFKLGLPLLIFIAFFEVNTSRNTFRDVQHEFTDNPQRCMEFNRDLLRKTLLAEKEGKDSISCIVPNFGHWDNWPITRKFYCAGYVWQKHGRLHKEIRIILRRDNSMSLHQISEPFFILDKKD